MRERRYARKGGKKGHCKGNEVRNRINDKERREKHNVRERKGRKKRAIR